MLTISIEQTKWRKWSQFACTFSIQLKTYNSKYRAELKVRILPLCSRIGPGDWKRGKIDWMPLRFATTSIDITGAVFPRLEAWLSQKYLKLGGTYVGRQVNGRFFPKLSDPANSYCLTYNCCNAIWKINGFQCLLTLLELYLFSHLKSWLIEKKLFTVQYLVERFFPKHSNPANYIFAIM